MKATVQQETMRHQEAFEYYYSLGEARSLREVGDKFSTSETSVKKWSASFNWRERVQQRDIEAARELAKQNVKAVVEEKARYRKLIKAMVADFVQRFQAGEVRLNSVQDLERVMKLDLLLMGEVTERAEMTGQVNTSHEYHIEQELKSDPESIELLKQLYRRRASMGGAGAD